MGNRISPTADEGRIAPRYIQPLKVTHHGDTYLFVYTDQTRHLVDGYLDAFALDRRLNLTFAAASKVKARLKEIHGEAI